MLVLEVPSSVGYAEAQLTAMELLEGLEREQWPHITVLYLGSTPSSSMATIEATVREVLEAERPGGRSGGPSSLDVYPSSIGYFGDGRPGSDGVPIVIHYHSWDLERLQVALMRALAPHMSVRQYPRFIPHATLGYLKRTLSAEEDAALARTQVEALKQWAPASLVLRRGEEEVARFSLMSARIDSEDAEPAEAK